MKRTLFLTTLLVLTLFLASCITQPNDPGDALNQEARSDFEVIVNPENSFEEKATKSMTRNPNEIENYYVNYIGRTTPVTINSTNTLTDEWEENIRVAANNVIIKEKEEKKYAFITYNTADNNLQGAIQVVDVTDPLNPVVIVEVHARMIKINAIEYNKEKNEMIFGGTDNYEGTFIRKFNIDEILTNGKEAISDPVYFSKMSLLSDVENLGTVTSVKYYNGNYYVSIGNYGGIVKLDDNFNFANFKNKNFIKDLEIYNNNLYGLVSKIKNENKGEIIKIDNSLNLTTTFEIEENFNSDSKAELEIYEHNISGGKDIFLYTLSNKGYGVKFDNGNYTDSTTINNSISYDEGLMFRTVNSENGTGFNISSLNFIKDNNKEVLVEVEELGNHFYSEALEGSWVTNASSNDADYLVMKNRTVNGEKQNLGLLINAAGEEGALFYYVQNEYATYSSDIDLNHVKSIIDSNKPQNYQLKVNEDYKTETIRFDFVYLYSEGGSNNDYSFIKYDSPAIETTESLTMNKVFTNYLNGHYSANDTYTKEISLDKNYFGFINEVSKGGNQTFSNINSLNSDDTENRIVFIYDELGNEGKGQLIVASEDWTDNDYNEPIMIFRTRDHNFKDIFSFEPEDNPELDIKIDLKIE
ncbi:hypothetical protein [Geotoga petraea]|uniref:Uncharacterized protein n=1 Tax=Geotoga petraea TaxID=28234 RepID=A0A4Z0W635_9BACT|nr:hypothetical protein [Geotoga petraea]TGG89290.1 hypothetical protein E4650_03625 [Geotoga petraea]